MCDYSWPRVSSLFGLREPALLISDGQNADHIATYERVDAHPLAVQLWLMVLSDVHVGNPQSSMDYMIWAWKHAGYGPAGWRMLPRDCYPS